MFSRIITPESVQSQHFQRGDICGFESSGTPIPPGFLEKYDSSTVFYRVVWSVNEDCILLIGPLLGDFANFLYIGGVPVLNSNEEDIKVVTLDRINRIEVSPRLLNADGTLTISLISSEDAANETFTVKPQQNYSNRFSGLKIIHTQQQNNDLEWIADWVKYYCTLHDVDAVVIYDNNSTRYSHEELLETVIEAGNGQLKAALIVNWSFIYGPCMSPWTAFFSQLGAFEDSFRSYYQNANLVINVDIDEFIMGTTQSLEEALDNSPQGVINIPGAWLESNLVDDDLDENLRQSPQPRLWKYGWVDPQSFYQGKWVIRPQSLLANGEVIWGEHYIVGRQSREYDMSFRITHVRGLTTGWYDNKRSSIATLTIKHFLDPLWAECLVKVFGDIVPESRIKKAQAQLGTFLLPQANERFSFISESKWKDLTKGINWSKIHSNAAGEIEFECKNILDNEQPVVFVIRSWAAISELECFLKANSNEELEEARKVLITRGVNSSEIPTDSTKLILTKAVNKPSNRKKFAESTANILKKATAVN